MNLHFVDIFVDNLAKKNDIIKNESLKEQSNCRVKRNIDNLDCYLKCCKFFCSTYLTEIGQSNSEVIYTS